jgi:hypothetical protein
MEPALERDLYSAAAESRKGRSKGNMYGILAAIFIATAFYGMERRRFQIVLGLAALVIAPVVFGLASGSDGLIYSLVGAFAALFLTLPLSILGFVSREDIIVSMALGGILGAVQYAIAFCIATAFLSIQRMFKVESSASAAVAASAAGPCGTRLLAFDEQSALVEIEMLKIFDAGERGRTSRRMRGARGLRSQGRRPPLVRHARHRDARDSHDRDFDLGGNCHVGPQ